MKRKLVAFLVATVATLPGGAARADAQPCNLKAIAHTAEHIVKANDPARIRRLEARFERLRNRCWAVPRH